MSVTCNTLTLLMCPLLRFPLSSFALSLNITSLRFDICNLVTGKEQLCSIWKALEWSSQRTRWPVPCALRAVLKVLPLSTLNVTLHLWLSYMIVASILQSYASKTYRYRAVQVYITSIPIPGSSEGWQVPEVTSPFVKEICNRLASENLQQKEGPRWPVIRQNVSGWDPHILYNEQEQHGLIISSLGN